MSSGLKKGSVPERISSSRFGIKDVSVAGDVIYFSDYSVHGNIIASAPSDGAPVGDYDEDNPPGLFIDNIDNEDKLENP